MRQAGIRLARRSLGLTCGRTLLYVPNRSDLPDVLNHRRLLDAGYEVGVQKGEFSAHLLGRWKGSRLISVDAWRVNCEEDPARPGWARTPRSTQLDWTQMVSFGAEFFRDMFLVKGSDNRHG